VAKGDACFYCRNATNARPDIPGWAYDCKAGIDNTTLSGGIEVAMQCPQVNPRFGFQVGGHLKHMWFEKPPGRKSDCMEWIWDTIDTPELPASLHICNFTQLERFVEFWGKELRRRGWIKT
jgi:hypothetical protein